MCDFVSGEEVWRGGGLEEEDAVLYSAAPPARAIRPYGALPRSLLITDCRKRARRLAQSKNNNHWKSRAGHDGSLNWEPRLEGEGDGMGDWKISRVFSRNHNLVLIGLVQLGSRLGSDVRF